MILKEQCEMQHGLMYFELHFLFTELNIWDYLLDNVPFLLPEKSLLNQYQAEKYFSVCKMAYEKYKTVFDQNQYDFNELNVTLEIYLQQLYQARSQLWQDLIISLNLAKCCLIQNYPPGKHFFTNIQHVESLMDHIDHIMDKIVMTINYDEDPSEELKTEFETNLSSLMSTIEALWQPLIRRKKQLELKKSLDVNVGLSLQMRLKNKLTYNYPKALINWKNIQTNLYKIAKSSDSTMINKKQSLLFMLLLMDEAIRPEMLLATLQRMDMLYSCYQQSFHNDLCNQLRKVLGHYYLQALRTRFLPFSHLLHMRCILLLWAVLSRTERSSVRDRTKRCTQKIERKHLILRTRLKRLVRKTICFSKSIMMHDTVIGLFINYFEFGRKI